MATSSTTFHGGGFDSYFSGDVLTDSEGHSHFPKVDKVSSVQKQMYGLTLSLILTLRLPQVLDKLDEIFSVCTTVILGGVDDQTKESRCVNASDDYTSLTNCVETIPSKEIRRRQVVSKIFGWFVNLCKHLIDWGGWLHILVLYGKAYFVYI